VHGGLAVVHGGGELGELGDVFALRPNMTPRDIIVAVNRLAKGCCAAFMEQVGYMRGDGGKGSFTFGRIDGILETCLAARSDFHTYKVSPMVWQGGMNCLSGGDKNVTKFRAQELWPERKWTHAIADAALIAEYGRRRLGVPTGLGPGDL
jgi:hypothetical protein